MLLKLHDFIEECLGNQRKWVCVYLYIVLHKLTPEAKKIVPNCTMKSLGRFTDYVGHTRATTSF